VSLGVWGRKVNRKRRSRRGGPFIWELLVNFEEKSLHILKHAGRRKRERLRKEMRDERASAIPAGKTTPQESFGRETT